MKLFSDIEATKITRDQELVDVFEAVSSESKDSRKKHEEFDETESNVNKKLPKIVVEMEATGSNINEKRQDTHVVLEKSDTDVNNRNQNSSGEFGSTDNRQLLRQKTEARMALEIMKTALMMNVLTLELLLIMLSYHVLAIVFVNCLETDDGCDLYFRLASLFLPIRLLTVLIHPIHILVKIRKIHPISDP